MNAEQNEQPVEVLVGMVEAMLKRSEQYRREAEADGDINEGEKHARISSVLKEIVRLGNGLAAAAAKPEQPSSAERSAFDSTELVSEEAALCSECRKPIDARLSKAHCDKNEPVAMALNELRERIAAENDWADEQIQRIQEQAAQLCAVRAAAGLQVGTIEELCQRIKEMRNEAQDSRDRIEAMRKDCETWHKIAMEEMTR